MTQPSSQPPSQPSRPEYDDEISLVDLAKILVRRWKALVIIFVLVVGAALAYALLMPRTYQYVSIYDVAEKAPTRALEAPSSLVAKASNLYLGPLTRELIAEQGWENLPFEVTINNPPDTLLVTLSSQASPDYVEQVKALHEHLLERLQQGQQRLVERQQETLQGQLESTKDSLEALRNSNSPSAGELIATYTARIAELEASLADLQEGEVNQVAVQSLEPAGTSRTLIVALGLVFGAMLAVIGVFVMQFASLVRTSLREDKS